MKATSVLLFALAGFILDSVRVAIAKADRIGKFKIHQQGSAIFRFETDFGEFRILHRDKLLVHESRQRTDRIQFSEIKDLECRFHTGQALLEEFLFGLDPTDLLTRYRDEIDWYTVNIVKADGRRIPIYAAGHFMRREFLASWYFDIQERTLRAIGVLKDAEAEAEQIHAILRSELNLYGTDDHNAA